MCVHAYSTQCSLPIAVSIGALRATVGDEKEIIQRRKTSEDDPVYLLIMSVVSVVWELPSSNGPKYLSFYNHYFSSREIWEYSSTPALPGELGWGEKTLV